MLILSSSFCFVFVLIRFALVHTHNHTHNHGHFDTIFPCTNSVHICFFFSEHNFIHTTRHNTLTANMEPMYVQEEMRFIWLVLSVVGGNWVSVQRWRRRRRHTRGIVSIVFAALLLYKEGQETIGTVVHAETVISFYWFEIISVNSFFLSTGKSLVFFLAETYTSLLVLFCA